MPSIQCKIMATLDAGAWRSPSREHVEPWKTRWGDDYLGCDLSAEAAAANMLVSRYCLRGSAVPESLFLSAPGESADDAVRLLRGEVLVVKLEW